MSLGKCNCGSAIKYLTGGDTGSCNKYSVCKHYDQLEGELTQLQKEFQNLLEAANGLRVFREGTGFYNDAEDIVLKLRDKYEWVRVNTSV